MGSAAARRLRLCGLVRKLEPLLAEEQASYQAPDISDTSANLINDGRFVPDADVITSRHSHRGNVAYADGHVIPVNWRVGIDPSNTRPDF